MVLKNLILEGIVGSQAYGLETPESDEDRKGIFVESTEKILGLGKVTETYTKYNPDVEHHEIGKFIKLALAANPTILEMLFLDNYTVLEPLGKSLVDMRESFLSNRVAKTYGGYAWQQAERLQRREGDFGSDLKKRYAKHARHCFRLLDQGEQLMRTGELRVRVLNRKELFAIGELPPEELIEKFKARYEAFKKAEGFSVLPDEPDSKQTERFLLRVRLANFNVSATL
jgi:uncharacterized protein